MAIEGVHAPPPDAADGQIEAHQFTGAPSTGQGGGSPTPTSGDLFQYGRQGGLCKTSSPGMLNRIRVNAPYRASDAMEDHGNNEPSPSLLLPAVAFEGALAILAVVLGWLIGRNPLDSLHWSAAHFGLAAAAALVPLLVLIPCVLWPVGPLVDLLRVVEELLIPLFSHCRVVDLAIISVLAGIGEEMLFRPIAQRSIAELVGGAAGPWVGLVGAAVLFAAAHWITTTYAVIAGLIGLYLGWLWMATGNLLVPITTHAVYDFVVLVYLVRFREGVEAPPM